MAYSNTPCEHYCDDSRRVTVSPDDVKQVIEKHQYTTGPPRPGLVSALSAMSEDPVRTFHGPLEKAVSVHSVAKANGRQLPTVRAEHTSKRTHNNVPPASLGVLAAIPKA